MIQLYHGSQERVERPEIRVPNRRLDFGNGFYLTSSLQQATEWVRRRIEAQKNKGFVNCYEFLSQAANEKMSVLHFSAPNDEWLAFVMANRRQVDFHHNYDIVIGPVANDRVYTAFALYESGVIDKEILIAQLKTYRLVDQYLFHTERALRFLRFQEAIPVSL